MLTLALRNVEVLSDCFHEVLSNKEFDTNRRGFKPCLFAILTRSFSSAFRRNTMRFTRLSKHHIRVLFLFTLIGIYTFSSADENVKDVTPLGLPEGAIARLGKVPLRIWTFLQMVNS